jgi:ligand-binding sensor domain-containing protein
MGAIDRYEWTFDWSNALGWAQKQPVMVGTIWTDSMSQPDDEGIIHVGNVTLADMAMGHEYLWRGMNYRRGLVRIRNHWTRDWGIDGDAYIPAEELENLILNYQGDVCIPLPLTA